MQLPQQLLTGYSTSLNNTPLHTTPEQRQLQALLIMLLLLLLSLLLLVLMLVLLLLFHRTMCFVHRANLPSL
jgi:hypothetical protein